MDYYQSVYQYYASDPHTHPDTLLLIESIGCVVRKIPRSYFQRLSTDKEDFLGVCFTHLLRSPPPVQHDACERKKRAYFLKTVSGWIMDYVDQQSFVPANVRSRWKKILEKKECLEQELQRRVSDHELGDFIGMRNVPLLRSLSEVCFHSLLDSYPEDAYEQRDVSSADVFDVHTPNPADSVELSDLVQHLLESTSCVERFILHLYYWERLKECAIARKLCVSPNLVSHRHCSALEKMRRAYRRLA